MYQCLLDSFRSELESGDSSSADLLDFPECCLGFRVESPKVDPQLQTCAAFIFPSEASPESAAYDRRVASSDFYHLKSLGCLRWTSSYCSECTGAHWSCPCGRGLVSESDWQTGAPCWLDRYNSRKPSMLSLS
jgi:hypothetical protein